MLGQKEAAFHRMSEANGEALELKGVRQRNDGSPGYGWMSIPEIEEFFDISQSRIRQEYCSRLDLGTQYVRGKAGSRGSVGWIKVSAFLNLRFPQGARQNGVARAQNFANGELDETFDPDAPPSDALERLRLAKAQQEELKLEEMKGELVRVSTLREVTARVARLIRDATDRLQRAFGADAYEMMSEAVDQMAATVNEFNPGGAERK
jgi:methyl-accepting chemotaxis protein